MHSTEPRSLEPCALQCPQLIRETLDIIASKWAVPVFIALHESPVPLRYADLQRRLGAITPKELAKHLRALESRALVSRTVYPSVPPRVEYALTESGRSLFPALVSLATWASDH